MINAPLAIFNSILLTTLSVASIAAVKSLQIDGLALYKFAFTTLLVDPVWQIMHKISYYPTPAVAEAWDKVILL